MQQVGRTRCKADDTKSVSPHASSRDAHKRVRDRFEQVSGERHITPFLSKARRNPGSILEKETPRNLRNRSRGETEEEKIHHVKRSSGGDPREVCVRSYTYSAERLLRAGCCCKGPRDRWWATGRRRRRRGRTGRWSAWTPRRGKLRILRVPTARVHLPSPLCHPVAATAGPI